MSDEDHKATSNPEGTANLEQSEMQSTADASSNTEQVETSRETPAPTALGTEISESEQTEIDDSNAEDAEDIDNVRRHEIPFLDYNSLSLENLVGELQRLLRNEKVQAIKRHVDAIKQEFDEKFQEFIEQKKEEFLERGGSEIDFQYNSVTKREFNELYSEYKEKRNEYYKSLEQALLKNLANRLEIIEAIKGLVSMEEDMNSTYKTFKDLQERWREAGPIPRANYNDVWRNYQHHVEIFYDFLHLNRELRDLDFRHNLEEKEKLAERAEALVLEPNLTLTFRELQTLHKIWKEDIGPVAREHRDAIWDRFSNATKAIHQRRQELLQEQEKKFETNLKAKNDIILALNELEANVSDSHRDLQLQIKSFEKLREQFFKIGKVPQKENESVWSAFKNATRKFNRYKNSFYRNLKKEQQENLEKKRALLERARALQDSEDWDIATPELKRIQQEWKETGHVPHKFSDKIWKQFKTCCNAYFDRYNASRNKAQDQERDLLNRYNSLLETLKSYKLSGNREADFQKIQEFTTAWKELGALPHQKKHLNVKFQKIIDALLRKLGIDKEEAEILRSEDRIQDLEGADDNRAIEVERQFIRKKLDEIKAEIIQLENNLLFFSDQSTQNPLYLEVLSNLEKRQETLAEWKEKLKTLNIMRNSLQREEEKETSEDQE